MHGHGLAPRDSISHMQNLGSGQDWVAVLRDTLEREILLQISLPTGGYSQDCGMSVLEL